MKNYQIVETIYGETVINYEENGIFYTIPTDINNSDYQAYLKWAEEQKSE